jgi:hypothetical protein
VDDIAKSVGKPEADRAKAMHASELISSHLGDCFLEIESATGIGATTLVLNENGTLKQDSAAASMVLQSMLEYILEPMAIDCATHRSHRNAFIGE